MIVFYLFIHVLTYTPGTGNRALHPLGSAAVQSIPPPLPLHRASGKVPNARFMYAAHLRGAQVIFPCKVRYTYSMHGA